MAKRDPIIGEKVRVHKNLQRERAGLPDHWSVTVGGLVIANVESIILADVTPHYWDGGRPRNNATQKRKVHAWLCGTVAARVKGAFAGEVRYNPYRSDYFTIADRRIERAEYVAFERRAVAHGVVR
jgi:hypothetical protein